jgi:hypothetical protein
VNVEYNGATHELDINQAVALGFLDRDVDGYLTPVAGKVNIEADQNADDSSTEEVYGLGTHAEGELEALRESLPEPMIDGMIHAAASGKLVNEAGEYDAAAIRSELELIAADHPGVSVEEISEAVGTLMQVGQARANQYVKSQGVDPNELWTWAKTAVPQAVRDSITMYMHNRTTAGFDHLVEHFKNSQRASEIGTEKGDELVDVGGIVTTRAAARLAGLI